MAKPKKDKYIRDLFEEDFYKKFFEFICSANKDVLVKNYFENRKNVSKEVKKEQIDRGVLYTSGLIAGEGLVGVLLAIFAVIKIGESSLADIINLSDFVNLGQIGSVIFFALLILTLFKFTIWYKDKNKAS